MSNTKISNQQLLALLPGSMQCKFPKEWAGHEQAIETAAAARLARNLRDSSPTKQDALLVRRYVFSMLTLARFSKPRDRAAAEHLEHLLGSAVEAGGLVGNEPLRLQCLQFIASAPFALAERVWMAMEHWQGDALSARHVAAAVACEIQYGRRPLHLLEFMKGTAASEVYQECVRRSSSKPLGIDLLHEFGFEGQGLDGDILIADIGGIDLSHTDFKNHPGISLSNPDHSVGFPHAHMVASVIGGQFTTGVAPQAHLRIDTRWGSELIGESSEKLFRAYCEVILTEVMKAKRGEPHACIINFSIRPSQNFEKDPTYRSAALEFEDAIAAAFMEDITVVLSAGNNGLHPKTDVDFGHLDRFRHSRLAVLVGAAHRSFTQPVLRAARDNSAGGLRHVPHVLAPIGYLCSMPGPGNVGIALGSSSAAPFVSGVIALMLQANPDLKTSEILLILMITAKKLPDHVFEVAGEGLVSPIDAVALALELKDKAEAKRFREFIQSRAENPPST